MNNAELEKLIDEFIKNVPDDDKDEFFCTTRDVSELVMENFKTFLKSRKKIYNNKRSAIKKDGLQ